LGNTWVTKVDVRDAAAQIILPAKQYGNQFNHLENLSQWVTTAEKGPGPAGQRAQRPKKRRRDTLALLAQSQGSCRFEYMLKVMRDEDESPEVRMDMAKAAAPYVHPKLSSVEQTSRPHDFSKLTDAEFDQLGRLVAKMEGVSRPTEMQGSDAPRHN
jgi:hypothetical protein